MSGNDSILALGATSLHRLYRARELSPVEYFEAVKSQIETRDPEYGAIVDTYFEEAGSQARDAERRFAAGDATGALEGMLVAVKDETPVRGKRTTSGSLLLRDHVDSADAIVVERIRAAGGIIHARTATPEFCCAPFTHSELWGATRNPWNTALSPGGSSGGAGVAVATGMTTVADGSDMGGSIRIPASYCGVVGYKPPFGRVPGVPPFNLDPYCVQGPLARSVEDCALLQDVLAGPDLRDLTTVPNGPSLLDALRFPVDPGGVPIAFTADGGGFPIDAETDRLVRLAAQAFRDLGFRVDEVAPEWTAADVLLAAQIHAGLTFGASLDEEVSAHPELVTSYVRKVAERARLVAKEDRSQGVEAELRVQGAMATLLQRYPIVMMPVIGLSEMPVGEDYVEHGPVVDGIVTEKHRDVMPTLIFNICSSLPVITVPCGRTAAGVPVGIQIAARPFEDALCFRVAAAFESSVNLHAERERLILDSERGGSDQPHPPTDHRPRNNQRRKRSG